MRGKLLLCFYQAFYLRTELLEELVVAFGYPTGDNQRDVYKRQVQQQEFGYGFLVVIYQYERERLHDGQLVKSTPVLEMCIRDSRTSGAND